jgi:hypothetical protein
MISRCSYRFGVCRDVAPLKAHSITVRAGDHIYHFRINQLPDSKVALKAEFPFASIHELVQFHEKENIIGGVQIALKVGYKDLNSHPWYHGIISAAETNRLLMAPPNQKGAFLVRDGTPEAIRQLDDTGLMVSFRTAEEGIIHYGMKLHPKGGYTMADGPAFDTPEKLITFYSGETVGNNNASLRRALTRTRSRRLSMPLVPEVPRPKDLGYVLVGGGAGAGIAVQQVATGSAGQGFGQIGYYQQHWMKQRTAQAATGAAGGGVAHR